jgi:hypothetical protein
VRICFMLSCLAPLFALTMIRGLSDEVVSGRVLNYICASLILVPTAVVFLRIVLAKKRNDKGFLQVTSVTQNKEYVFTYFFTVLLPLYSITISNNRELAAYLCAIAIIFFILFRLNLYYTNLFFVVFRYNVYVVQPLNRIVLSKKEISSGDLLTPYRLSNTVFIDL